MADNEVKIKVDSGGLIGNGLSKATDLLKGLPGVASAASAALSKLNAIAAGIAAAFAGAAVAVREFAAAQENVATLDAALAKQGSLTDENREKFQALAGEMQRLTSIADDEWLAVLTKLVQFGARPESIGMHVDAVKNLAGIVGDLGTATNLYSKALQGNFSALSRYGLTISETGDKAERLEQLQQQLAQRGGGQLEARAESLNGRFANLKNQISDVTEAIGQKIASTFKLADVIDFVAGGFEWWAEVLGDTVEKLDGISNSTVEAASSTRDYAAELTLVAQLSEKVAKATDEETRAIKAKQQAQDEIADAQMALDLANVDEAVRSGKLSNRQGVEAKARIRKAAATAKFEREQAADLAVIDTNERGLADLMKVRSGMAQRRGQLQKSIGPGSVAESRFQTASSAIAALELERKFVEEQGGSLEWKQSRFADIDRAIGIAQRIGPAFMDSQRKELGALDTSIGNLDTQIAARRGSVLTANTEAGLRMATRSQVFGLNQQRDAVVAGGESAAAGQKDFDGALAGIQQGTGRASAGMQQSLGAILSSTQAMVNFSDTILRIQQQTEQRLRQLEAQAKNQHNR